MIKSEIMKKNAYLILVIMMLGACQLNQTNNNTNTETEKLNQFMDDWHQAAAVADEKLFFDCLDSNSVYLGTDPDERWLKHEFMEWGMVYFQRDTAWAFKPYNRKWDFSDDMNYAWFDELLETHMGVCRGSGVLKKYPEGWKIKHYHLAITLPNDKMNEYRDLLEIPLK